MTDTATKERTGRSYTATNGLRDPDWRWQFARKSVPIADPAPLPDATCWDLAEFLEHGKKWITSLDGARQFSIGPLLAIHNDRLKRLTLESRVLAVRDLTIAAEASRLPVQVAHDYCSIFFDVGDRLHAVRAIDGKIIHAAGHRDDIVRRELYWHAYFGGPLVAEHWLLHLPFIGCGVEHDLRTAEGRQREQLELTMASREPAAEFYDSKLLPFYRQLLDREPNTRPYAECVLDHVTDALEAHWRRTPTKAARRILDPRIAA
ncbi:hypothetical protein Mal15_17890 [Stieleria maiorica]|uniref:Uncharacterized protein n=1 Tax=Stieleria maiorica TaxID=2795974 RepID=A0A5B9ME32_9BACT|nr:hypothetical protein [Stieleria maiorica]QEF97745.1 hypothetical protein Mal15_17890 [Stieleria maiorica]